MEKAFEDKLRKVLIARRMKLLRTDDEIVKDAQGLLENDDVDLEDHAQTAQASEVIAKLDNKDARELAEIDAAMGRLAEGQYGICAECGRRRGPARAARSSKSRTASKHGLSQA
jgi:DnaK suppressor protein